MATELINQIVSVMASYEYDGFSTYKSEWESLNAQADQLVDLHFGASKESGYVVGVSDLGALILQTESGEKVFHGGEISLRATV